MCTTPEAPSSPSWAALEHTAPRKPSARTLHGCSAVRQHSLRLQLWLLKSQAPPVATQPGTEPRQKAPIPRFHRRAFCSPRSQTPLNSSLKKKYFFSSYSLVERLCQMVLLERLTNGQSSKNVYGVLGHKWDIYITSLPERLRKHCGGGWRNVRARGWGGMGGTVFSGHDRTTIVRNS